MSSGMLCSVPLVEPHGVTSQKTPFFIVTAVKTSNLTGDHDISKQHSVIFCKAETGISKCYLHEIQASIYSRYYLVFSTENLHSHRRENLKSYITYARPYCTLFRYQRRFYYTTRWPCTTPAVPFSSVIHNSMAEYQER
jgi:hypothetical protein